MDLLLAFSAVRGQKFRSAAGTPSHYSMQILLPMPMQRNAVPALQMAGLMTVAAGERLLLSSRLFGLPTPSVLAMLSFGFPHLPFFDKKKRKEKKEFSHSPSNDIDTIRLLGVLILAKPRRPVAQVPFI